MNLGKFRFRTWFHIVVTWRLCQGSAYRGPQPSWRRSQGSCRRGSTCPWRIWTKRSRCFSIFNWKIIKQFACEARRQPLAPHIWIEKVSEKMLSISWTLEQWSPPTLATLQKPLSPSPFLLGIWWLWWKLQGNRWWTVKRTAQYMYLAMAMVNLWRIALWPHFTGWSSFIPIRPAQEMKQPCQKLVEKS